MLAHETPWYQQLKGRVSYNRQNPTETKLKESGYHESGSSIEELLNDPASLAIDKSSQRLNCHA